MRWTYLLALLLVAPLATAAEPRQERKAKTVDELAR
jgi:hypothetical protein